MRVIEADGDGCPMAHYNQNDDSSSTLPPLLNVGRRHSVRDDRVAPCAWDNLGAYSGQDMAVCAYESPLHSALVAYEYERGSVLWSSPLEDLPGFDRRRPHGVLLAKVRGDGSDQQCVFASNPFEIVAYTSGGDRLWKRRITDILGPAEPWIGAPTSLRHSPAGQLIMLTTGGWVLTLDPLDGSTVDARRLDTEVTVAGTRYEGTFIPIKTPVVIGDALYCLAAFWPRLPVFLPPLMAPISLVRVPLDRSEALQPLAVGVCRGTASPSGMVCADGRVLLFVAVSMLDNGRLRPGVVAVQDDRGELATCWSSALDVAPGDDVYSAPGLHPASRLLLVAAGSRIFVFRNVDTLVGQVPSPMPVPAGSLTALGGAPTGARAHSPFALVSHPEAGEVIAYTNFHVFPRFSVASYGFLGAFALAAESPGPARSLWSRPLALTQGGDPAPGPGTAGQPALFRSGPGHGGGTGIIVNTVNTGTHLFW